MIRVLIEGVNPEPWTSPSLGTKRVGRKIVPVSFKNENQRAYQEAVHELLEEALAELGIEYPVFGAGVDLFAEFTFWRQLDRFNVGDQGRTRVRKRPDLTNMVKATEDALQGLLYVNDQAILVQSNHLAGVGPEVEPALLVCIESLGSALPPLAWSPGQERTEIKARGREATSRSVWIESYP